MSGRVYRLLLLAYPRSFRLRFGPDMAQAFADLAARSSAPRLWARTAADFAVSAPRQRWEYLMDRIPPRFRTYMILALAVVSAVAVVLVGSAVPLSLPILAFATCVLAVSRRHQLVDLARTGSRWYLFVAAGAVILAAIALLADVLPDYHGAPADFLWFAAFFAFLFAWLLIATGVVLGALAGLRRLRPATAPPA